MYTALAQVLRADVNGRPHGNNMTEERMKNEIWCLPEISERRVTTASHQSLLLSYTSCYTDTMEDPLSAVHDRPHRYLLDSDSEDEEGQGIYSPSTSGPSRISKLHISSSSPAKVSISNSGSYEEVVIGIGQAGKYLCRKFGMDSSVKVKVGEEVVGTGGDNGGRLILALNDELVEDLHSLAGALIGVQTKSW